MFKRLRNEQGFLLFESVVAIMIISVALVACIGVLIQSHQGTKASAGHTAAVYLAQRQAELLKGSKSPQDWNNLFPSLPTDLGSPVVTSLNGITYTVTTKADICKENSALVEVTIGVSWREYGREELYQLITAFPARNIKRVT